VFLRRYLTSSFTGQDDLQSLSDRMARAAARAIEIDPWEAQAWLALGIAYLYRGRHEFNNGGQSASWWNAAVEAFGNALMIEPDDVRASNDLGTAHRLLGNGLYKTGSDPRPEYQEALRVHERALELDPQYLPACTSQVDLHVLIAEYKDMSGGDPRRDVDDAARIGKHCLEINPRYYALLDNLAQAQLVLARHLSEIGDPMPALTAARSYLDRAEDVEHQPLQVWYHRLVAAGIEAAFRLQRSEDPTSSIATGRRAFDDAARLMPRFAEASVEAVRLDLIEAVWARRAGHAFAPMLARARTRAEDAVSFDKTSATAQQVAAEVYLELAKTQPSRAVIEQGTKYARDALRLNPLLARAKTIFDELERLRAP
jgi:tetratricopeptide (TPR) repeat protein